jgi:peptidoglycan/LPS O-acetylase OafA/YrhL
MQLLAFIQARTHSLVIIHHSLHDRFMPHTWTVSLDMQLALVCVPVLCAVLRMHRSNNKNDEQQQQQQQQTLRGCRMYACVAAALLLTIVARAFGVLSLLRAAQQQDGDEEEGAQLIPMPIHTLDMVKEPLPCSVTRLYSALYLPLVARGGAFVCGIGAGFAMLEKQQQQQQPSWAKRRIATGVALLAFALAPRFTSHDRDTPGYAPLFVLCWLVLARIAFALVTAQLLVWMLCHHHRRASTKHQEDDDDNNSIVASVRRALSWPGFYALAQLSWASYLLHVLVLGGVLSAVPVPSADAHALNDAFVCSLGLLCYAITALVAGVAHRFVELPMQRCCRRHLH